MGSPQEWIKPTVHEHREVSRVATCDLWLFLIGNNTIMATRMHSVNVEISRKYSTLRPQPRFTRHWGFE